MQQQQESGQLWQSLACPDCQYHAEPSLQDDCDYIQNLLLTDDCDCMQGLPLTDACDGDVTRLCSSSRNLDSFGIGQVKDCLVRLGVPSDPSILLAAEVSLDILAAQDVHDR